MVADAPLNLSTARRSSMPSMVGKAPSVTLSAIRTRVDKLLHARGLTAKWLYERIGMSKTGFRDMWTDGTVRFTTLQAIAEALGVDLAALLTDAEPEPRSAVSEPVAPYGGRFIEQRIADLEQQVRDLRRRLHIPITA